MPTNTITEADFCKDNFILHNCGFDKQAALLEKNFLSLTTTVKIQGRLPYGDIQQ